MITALFSQHSRASSSDSCSRGHLLLQQQLCLFPKPLGCGLSWWLGAVGFGEVEECNVPSGKGEPLEVAG